jgi:hypothetical protein
VSRRLLRAADRFLFAPVSPIGLGILRVVLLGFLVVVRLPEEVGRLLYRNVWPPEFMVPGVWLRLSPIPFPFPVEHLEAFHTAMVLAGACAAIGFLTRPALLLFTLGYVYLKGVESAWGSFDHEPTIVVQILAILIVAPGVSACSLDRVLRWLLRRRAETPAPVLSTIVGPAVPRWGVQLVLLTIIMGYFGAGVAKLRHGGVAWLDGQTLAFYMTGHSQSSRIQQLGSAVEVRDERKWKDGFGIEFYLLGAQSSRLGAVMSRHQSLFVLAAIGALSFELLSPLMLLGGPFRVAVLLGAAGMHLFIDHFLNISFVSWIVIDLAMLDWPWLTRGLTFGLLTGATSNELSPPRNG